MTSSDQTPRPSPLAIGLAGALSLAVAMGIGRFAFTPMLPLMLQGGQLDVAAGGWLAAANYAGYLAGAMTASRWAATPSRMAVLALLLTALLTAAMALPGPPLLWAVFRFMAGVASAWAFIATSLWCLAALARVAPSAWSSALYAGVGGGIAVAGLYCLAGGANGVPTPALWLGLGLLAGLLVLPVLAVLRRMEPSRPPPAVPASGPQRLPAGTRGLVVCYGLLGFGYILPATFLPVLARQVVQEPLLFGLAWPVFGLMAALSAVLAGWFVRKAGRLRIWAISHALMGVGVLLPSLWLSGWTIAFSALLVGGTFMVATLAGIQEIRARVISNPAPLVARMTAAFALGQIAGPVLSALLLHTPQSGARGLDLALQLGAASLLASAAWLWHRPSPSFFAKEMPHVR